MDVLIPLAVQFSASKTTCKKVKYQWAISLWKWLDPGDLDVPGIQASMIDGDCYGHGQL